MDSCKCGNRSDYIETCCFNPTIYFICKLCRGKFENAEKLILHKRQQHSLKDLKGIKFIIFEERFTNPDEEDNTIPNESASTLPELECKTADNSSDNNSVVSPLHQDDSPEPDKTVIPEKELTRKSTKKSNDADAEQLKLNLNEALSRSHANNNDLDSVKTEKQFDFEDLDSFALITEIESDDSPNSPVSAPVPPLVVPSITETKPKDPASYKNYDSEEAVPSVQVTTPKIRDSSQTETLTLVSPPFIDGVRPTRLLQSQSKINYSENLTCGKCIRGFYTVEKLEAHEKVCVRYKNNREQEKSGESDSLKTTPISDEAAETTYDNISLNPIDLEVKFTDCEGDQEPRPGPVITTSRDSDFESSKSEVNVSKKKVISYRHRKVKHITKTREKPLSFKCTICSKELTTKLGFKRHMEVHKNPNLKPFVCEICGSGFRQKSKLQNHQVSHSEDRPFKCKLCPRTFKNKVVLRRHGSVHAEETNYHCQPCNKSFKTRDLLQKHSKYHSNEKWYPCKAEHCDVKFPAYKSLWLHCKKDHAELFSQLAKLSCTVCNEKFMFNSQLKRHMISHGEEKPFKCSEEGCNGTFITRQSLEEHCRKHTGERPFQCDTCGSTFARSCLFYIHLKKHKNPKVRVLCHLCPKSFSSNWELQQHLTFHENGRQFSCKKCDLKFMLKANLKGHMKTHERKDATDDGSNSSSSESEVESEDGTTQESEPESEQHVKKSS